MRRIGRKESEVRSQNSVCFFQNMVPMNDIRVGIFVFRSEGVPFLSLGVGHEEIFIRLAKPILVSDSSEIFHSGEGDLTYFLKVLVIAELRIKNYEISILHRIQHPASCILHPVSCHLYPAS